VAAIVFDSGALIALERGDRRIAVLLDEATAGGVGAVTSSACVAEVWRNPARQARLTRALAGFRECSLDPAAARACGTLLAQAATDDIADAALCQLAGDGDTILTSNPSDMARLLRARGVEAQVRAV
jgi:hypothetical protein